MCGILGGFDRSGEDLDQRLAEAGCQRMRHRGPDDQGIFAAEGMLVANRRLSILDLASGHQPMFSDDGQIAVVQNGEIYNFVELARGLDCRTHCDTEVILRLYERDGEDFVRQLNGMFAIAILDRRAGKLLLYRDRVGKKPLYLYDDGHQLLFASEIKSLLAMGAKRELDPIALDAYLTFNFVPPPLTIFRNIRHLPPGHQLRIDRNGIRERAWWDLGSIASEERSLESWCDALLATLEDATRIRLRSDVPLGAFLSGGIDSSSVVAMMSRLLPHPAKTFAIGFDDPRFDESTIAEEVARQFATEHTTEIVRYDMTSAWPLTVYHNDQPHGDASFMPTYWVSQLARRHVTVVLTGDGGDELFAGYDVHKRFVAGQDLGAPRDAIERGYVDAITLMPATWKRQLYTESFRAGVAGVTAMDHVEPFFVRHRHQDPINMALALDVQLLLPGNNLVKPDKMAMAVSLEPRSPFLDARMVELAFRIPGWLKLRDGHSKWIFKRAAQRILPAAIVHRKKQMFTVPIGEWFKNSLRPLVEECLLSDRSAARGLFEPKILRRMIADHAEGRANFTRELRALIALELWQRTFLDANFDHAPTFEELGITPPHAVPTSRRAA